MECAKVEWKIYNIICSPIQSCVSVVVFGANIWRDIKDEGGPYYELENRIWVDSHSNKDVAGPCYGLENYIWVDSHSIKHAAGPY